MLQDLVEVLSAEKTWYTPSKVSQQAYERNAEGEFAGFEEEVGKHSIGLLASLSQPPSSSSGDSNLLAIKVVHYQVSVHVPNVSRYREHHPLGQRTSICFTVETCSQWSWLCSSHPNLLDSTFGL